MWIILIDLNAEILLNFLGLVKKVQLFSFGLVSVISIGFGPKKLETELPVGLGFS